LKKENIELRINNLGKDLADSIALSYVMHSLDSSFSLEGLKEEDNVKRAELVIAGAMNIGVPELIRPVDITTGNTKLNTVFVAELFNIRHGLEELTKEEYEAAKMLEEGEEGSKEERQFRLWINSLGIDDLYITNLYDENLLILESNETVTLSYNRALEKYTLQSN